MQELKANFKDRIAAILADNPNADLLPKLNQTTLGEAIGLDRNAIRGLDTGDFSRIQVDKFDAISNVLMAHGFELGEIWDTGDTMTASKMSHENKTKAMQAARNQREQ